MPRFGAASPKNFIMSHPPGAPIPQPELDVIIVGGGPAGLSAALLLRAMPAAGPGVRLGPAAQRRLPCAARLSFPRRLGAAEFLQIGREQLAPYETVTYRKVKVQDVERTEGCFTAILENGERISARTLLLATGLVDELPPLENFRQFYGVSAHNCPYCDGWEHRAQPMAVVGCDRDAVELALELRLWSKDILLCTNGSEICDTEALSLLERNGVEVNRKPIARLEGTGDRLERIVFRDGAASARQALFFSPGQHQRSTLAEKLGCSFCDKDGCVECEQDASTCVPGLFVAGNASRGLQLIIAAAAEGAHAAFAINCALAEADGRKGVLKSGAGDENAELPDCPQS